jgi:S-DNA-T family DNA segregation ATPase FtsK/SpoIIIE
MSTQLLIDRQRVVLRDLLQGAAERAAAETETESSYRARNDAAEKEFQESRQRVVSRYESEKGAAEAENRESKERIVAEYEAAHKKASDEFEETRQRIAYQFRRTRRHAEADYKDAKWTLATIYEAGKKKVKTQLGRAKRSAASKEAKIQKFWDQAGNYLAECGQSIAFVPSTAEQKDPPAQRLKQNLANAEETLARLQELSLPRFLKGDRFFLTVACIWAALQAPLALPALWNWWYVGVWLGVSTALVIGGGYFLRKLLVQKADEQVANLYRPLCQALTDAESARRQWVEEASAHAKRQLQKKRKKRDEDRKHAKTTYETTLAESQKRREADAWQADQKYQPLLAEIERRREEGLRETEERYKSRVTENQSRYDEESHQAGARHSRLLADSHIKYEAAWKQMATSWRQALTKADAEVMAINGESLHLYPAWNDPVWADWTPQTKVPAGVRFGQLAVKPDLIPHSQPQDARLKDAAPPHYVFPAHLPFPEQCSLLIKAADETRNQAVQTLQAVMLRFLTGLPPGKCRFTIIDPVGLGENFAAFMHLADYDEALVTNRIWTEAQHIEQRLVDLTEHMENVIQKYLRNQYKSIEEYNEQAGEVAEPYRILVVANFPTNFSAEAARRLVSIASSGGSCGVYVLTSVDTKHAMPQGFRLADLEQVSLILGLKEGRIIWKDDDFNKYPLQLDAPPGDAFLTPLLHKIGAKAKDANRVEVSFDFLAPTNDQYWSSDSRPGIDVPLGRAGATKRQHLRLGQGTAQHVLIAGKTGSGKSTLLHVLVTNISLLYSPDEIELYLVDFKKGVEFKTYAMHALPHARVIAIESEREFGLSVLQRLDAELKYRGDRFRDLNVHDLKSYRDATGKPLPRILLVVDEFQEFFVEDDKVAQEAALLLDRLVRQGRAFGLHVLLGSQTLGGAYTLARSTIDQMAVRIALQCSEADAHLILSRDNSAARLLSRPGEAIYNDANGLVEGNDVFQVVWLPDDRREKELRRIQELTRTRYDGAVRPQIVFEGNAPADPAKNHLLDRLLAAPAWPETVRAAQAWLGEAIAIKDPTAAVFRPQSGSNLIIIGQQEDAALGSMCTMLASLAAQHPPASLGCVATHPTNSAARFCILDGSPVDDPHAGFLSRFAGVAPHPVQSGAWREVPVMLNELADEVDRRQKDHDTEAPSIYLFVYGLHRFRDLRKADDDFGFSRRGEEKPNPSKQFLTILREGPPVGVHTIVWCDSVNNVNRSLDRAGLREFEMRVLFQMSAADSSNLIDSPVANKLGLHRALFHSEDRGQPEKFRPYGIPGEGWMEMVRERLRGRAVVEAERQPTGAV